MPLASGSSQEVITSNIAEMIKAGDPAKQAEAAAYRMARGDATATQAAGILFLTAAGEVLLLKRGPGSDHPGEWCFPGGHAEGAETLEQTAEREAIEELGFLPDGERIVLTRSVSSNEISAQLAPNGGLPPTDAAVIPGEQIDYTTFLQRVPERFDPQISGEHTGFAWCKPTEPPEPLHPGCRVALARLTMDELGVARAMAAGELTSPQRYHNVWLFDIRITGTGQAYRGGINEHVWRDPTHYLTDEFLARCNGLTVVWVHPEKSMLNSKEFSDRVIGSCFLPYIKGDSVWSIAKIYDAEAAEDMATQDLSTSPGVVLGGGDDVRLKFGDGSVLLKEGKPVLVDHIAIVPAGVWDLGGAPSGIRSDSTKEFTMADETEAERKAREEKEKSDGANIKLALDSMASMMDAMGKRFDAIEAADKARRDAEENAKKDAEEKARADAKKRRDAEHEAWMAEDAAECAREDAQEEREAKEHEAKGEDEEAAADKARRDRRDRMDKRRKDAEKAEQDKKDAEKREADARRDVQGSIAATVVDEMRKLTRSDADTAALSAEQARADAVHAAFGTRAPAPMLGEAAGDYQLRLARPFQKYSKDWKDSNLAVIDAGTRDKIVGHIYNDAVAASKSDALLPETLTRLTHTNESGHVITSFRGRNSIFKQFSAPVMAVTQFKTEKRA